MCSGSIGKGRIFIEEIDSGKKCTLFMAHGPISLFVSAADI